MQHQAERINKDVAFLSLDFLAAVVARRVNRDPPFSALFTLWLSMMAALGLSNRTNMRESHLPRRIREIPGWALSA